MEYIVKPGMRFLHSRFINEDRTPAEYEVTRVTFTAIYYKAKGAKKAEWKSSPEKFSSMVKEVLS